MDEYTITITLSAHADLIEMEANMTSLLRSEESGTNCVDSFFRFIETLQFFPHRFPQIRESLNGTYFQRKCVLNHYNIYYDVDDEAKAVYIIRIIHCKQKQPNCLSDVFDEGDELYPNGQISLSDLTKGMSEEECRIYLTEMIKRNN